MTQKAYVMTLPPEEDAEREDSPLDDRPGDNVIKLFTAVIYEYS